jgi:putative ABC transport system substrate-binding protein
MNDRRKLLTRREFITLIGSAATAALAAGATAGETPTIGFLGPNTRADAAKWIAAFLKRLGELGWVDGRTVKIDYRWVEGQSERFARIAEEFARRKVDVVVTSGTPATMALQKASSTIPIVFATAGDPVNTGLVTSLARPGGHTTGLATQGDDIAGKRLELMREVLPRLRRLAVMGNVSNSFTVLEMGYLRKAAGKIGMNSVDVAIRRAQDIPDAFKGLRRQAEALYVCTDASVVHANRVQINTSALREKLPTMQGSRTYLDGGGLMSYGPDFPDLFRRSAEIVDKILRGAKPSDIPVEQPTKFDLVVNLRTAKALGLEVPRTLLVRADELIE